LPGLSFDLIKRPIWSNAIKISASGLETRTAFWTYPRWSFDLVFEVLRSGGTYMELERLISFYNSVRGSVDSWLYRDPFDCLVRGQNIGTGDGINATFQLVRRIFNWVEPVRDVDADGVSVYLDGAQQYPYNYTVNDRSDGTVVFNTPPAAGVAVTADFTFYFRCRFCQDNGTADEVGTDAMEFNNFMYNLWEAQTVKFLSVKGE